MLFVRNTCLLICLLIQATLRTKTINMKGQIKRFSEEIEK